MTKNEAITAVYELLQENGISATREEAQKLVEIGMQVRAKIQPMSEIFEEEERKAQTQIEWTAEQRKLGDRALEAIRKQTDGEELK